MTVKEDKGLTAKEYLEQIIQDDLKIFSELTKWNSEDIDTYTNLLENLKKPFDKFIETAKSKGDRLEDLVDFIVKKTYFFEVFENIHTGTNEADQVIILSDKGKQALHKFKLSRELLVIKDDILLGECKNYDTTLNVTYIGKFYSVLIACDINFGIIFTQKGLTGSDNEYRDAYGLTKVLRLTEKHRNNRDFYIIDFKLEDYEALKNGQNSFFEIVKAKMYALQLAADYNQFLKDNTHESESEIKNAVSKYSKK